MEQHSAVAQWGADGKLTLWSSTQTPHYVHRLLAKILDAVELAALRMKGARQ
jgi:4-hydroxybenzoyl-CoA reductase subunit alpha